MQSALNREYRKMYRNLNGIRTMNRLPECLVVIDPKKEKNAVSEARKLGIATVALIDTDCDPDLVDLPIPGNDDSMRSIEIVIKMLADAILAGKSQAAIAKPAGGRRRATSRPRQACSCVSSAATPQLETHRRRRMVDCQRADEHCASVAIAIDYIDRSIVHGRNYSRDGHEAARRNAACR